jgi:CRP/FNR family cyclic AMP-dependent transcriptional regulator
MVDNPLFSKYGQTVDSGKIIFEEHDVGDQMYIIQEGSVRISKTIGGKEHTLAVLTKGDFFGEMAIVNQVTRTATATAVGTVRLLAFNREGFLGMIEKNARIGLSIIDKLCRRLQHANTQIQHLARRNEKGLIALNLLYAFREQGMENAELDHHKTAREISLNLGFPLEKVLGILGQFQEQRVIKVEGAMMRLIDQDRLGLMAESEK